MSDERITVEQQAATENLLRLKALEEQLAEMAKDLRGAKSRITWFFVLWLLGQAFAALVFLMS